MFLPLDCRAKARVKGFSFRGHRQRVSAKGTLRGTFPLRLPRVGRSSRLCKPLQMGCDIHTFIPMLMPKTVFV